MPKIIRIKDCLECPLSSISHCEKVKDHKSFVSCKSGKYPKPRTVGTLLFVSTKNFIPKWCPLQDEGDYLRGWCEKCYEKD